MDSPVQSGTAESTKIETEGGGGGVLIKECLSLKSTRQNETFP